VNVQVFDAVHDAEAWRRTLGRLPAAMQDVYFQPEYLALHQGHPDSRAAMFAYCQSEHIWVNPFLLQPITKIGTHSVEQPWFDIETPNGYGGPLSSTDDAEFLSEAHAAFTEWCGATGIVAEFVRLHPLLENQRWLDPLVEVRHDRETVSISLADIDPEYTPSVGSARNMLRRATRLGVQVSAYPPPEHIGRFQEMYSQTMALRDAEDFYLFDSDYFKELAQVVNNAGYLLVAQIEDEWVAAALFLKGHDWLHYHLAASGRGKQTPGASNQILATAALMGHAQGLTKLHLGGGRSVDADDSLLGFKRSMATDSHSFLIGMRVHDQAAYGELCGLSRREFPELGPNFGNRLLCYRYGSETA